MKKLKLFAMVLILPLLFACQEESNLVGPEKSSVSTSEPSWISIPASENNQLKKVFSVTQLITAQSGGVIRLDESYEGGPFGNVMLSAEIKFAPGTIDEDTYFTMAFDDEAGVITFSPSMTFNQDAPLTISLKGIDLSDVNIDDIGFVYFDANGEYVDVDAKKLWVKTNDGSLGVLQAQIPHFSRYGFTK